MGKRDVIYNEPKATTYINTTTDAKEKAQAIKDRKFDNMLGWIIQQKGFTNEEIVDRAEINKRDLYRYLEGSLPSQKAVIRLAMALEQPLEDANRMLKSANCGPIDDLNEETAIIKRHYDAIVEEFKEHRDNSVYVCKSILKLNEELEKNGLPKLFVTSPKGRPSKYA